MKSLEGRTAIVTGASRGIGFSVAQELTRRGARVCITGRTQKTLDDAVRQLGGTDVAIGIAGKADDPHHQQYVVEVAVSRFGRIDMLVNNTGINPYHGPMVDISPSLAAKIHAVNVLAPLAWVKGARDAWMGENGGAVVNVASTAGLRASPGIGMYGVSKAGVIHLTAELAAELAPGIRVNAVAPAVVKTHFAEALYAGQEELLAASYPMKRLGTPNDISTTVAFLLSDEAAWMTGQTLVVDGGITTLGAGM